MKIFKQETNKSCGVACLRSILNYYGNNFSEKDIWDKHNPFQSKTGVLNPILNLGVTALKFGFNVTYIGNNYILTHNNSSTNLKKSLNEKLKSYFDYGKFYVNEALTFLELGGKIEINNLGIEKLKKLLDKEKFLLVEIKPAFLHKKGATEMNHKIILVGYTKKGFKILNPSDAKQHIIDFDTFLLAFYKAGPELLIIKKKK
jgi:Peptidase C39 family